jgi:type II secretory pathway component GspD/PulD (secretin)
MKMKHVFAVIVVVLAPCLAALGQAGTQTQSSSQVISPPPTPLQPPAPNGPQVEATQVIPPEPLPRPLPEGRSVSYANLVGPETNTNSNMPTFEDVPADVGLNEVDLPEAIRSLALQAHLNVQFDPSLQQIGPDGRVIPPPVVTVKWKDITAMQAMQALLDNYGWQMVWDVRTKVARITKKDAAAREPMVINVVALSYSNPSNIVREVENTLSLGSSMYPDMRTHQLIIRTTEKELLGVTALIKKLDTPTREVLVEAKIVETSKDITSAKGVDWTGTLAAQHVSFGNGLTQSSVVNSATSGSAPGVASSTSTSTVSPGGSPVSGGSASGLGNITSNVTSLASTVTTTVSGSTSSGGGFSMNTAHGFSPATAFLNADGVQAVLSFLNTDTDTKTIAFPRTVALDGVPTELAVVQNIPIFTQTQSAPAGGSASGLATIQPNYALTVQGTILNEVGVKLKVIPRIAGPTNVLLDLSPEISEQNGTVTETLNGQPNQAPSFQRSRITTQASVPSGYTLVLGGMDQDVVGNTRTKVPFFGDIPGLGSLFSSDSKTHSAQTTLIFVTPTIISDSDYQPSPTKFLRTKPESPSGIPESAWDSAEPYDWTKPTAKVSPDYQK